MFIMPHSFRGFLSDIIEILILLIIIEAVITNINAFGGRISSYNPFVRFVRGIVNPLLNPVRRLLPSFKTQGWDLSPLIVIVLLEILQRLLF